MTFPKPPLVLDCCFGPEDTVKFHFYCPERLEIMVSRSIGNQYADVLLGPSDAWAIVRYLLGALLEIGEMGD